MKQTVTKLLTLASFALSAKSYAAPSNYMTIATPDGQEFLWEDHENASNTQKVVYYNPSQTELVYRDFEPDFQYSENKDGTANANFHIKIGATENILESWDEIKEDVASKYGVAADSVTIMPLPLLITNVNVLDREKRVFDTSYFPHGSVFPQNPLLFDVHLTHNGRKWFEENIVTKARPLGSLSTKTQMIDSSGNQVEETVQISVYLERLPTCALGSKECIKIQYNVNNIDFGFWVDSYTEAKDSCREQLKLASVPKAINGFSIYHPTQSLVKIDENFEDHTDFCNGLVEEYQKNNMSLISMEGTWKSGMWTSVCKRKSESTCSEGSETEEYTCDIYKMHKKSIASVTRNCDDNTLDGGYYAFFPPHHSPRYPGKLVDKHTLTYDNVPHFGFVKWKRH